MELLCLSVALLALMCCLALTPLVRALAMRIGLVDQPGGRKIHGRTVAYGGGLAVAISMALALAVGGWVWRIVLDSSEWSDLRAFMAISERIVDPDQLRTLLVCLGGSLGALVLGLADDRWNLSPLSKLAGQFVLAIVVVAGGVRVTALVGDILPMQIASVLWIVLITNSFNLLDNMDGLCSGTVAISAAVLALIAMTGGESPVALTACALSGACIGFLWWNRSPARIFLGDAGSLFVGFMMACLTIVTTYYHYEQESVIGVGVPFLLLAIPLYDTASVIVIRLREGRKVWKGDTSHFSHRLVDLGMAPRQAVSTIHLAALAIALPATVIARLSLAEGLLLVGQSVLILTLIALVEHAGRKKALNGAGATEQRYQQEGASSADPDERV